MAIILYIYCAEHFWYFWPSIENSLYNITGYVSIGTKYPLLYRWEYCNSGILSPVVHLDQNYVAGSGFGRRFVQKKNSSLKRNRNLRTLLQYVLYKNVVLYKVKKIRIKLKIKVYTGNKTEDNSRVFFCFFQGIHLFKNSSFNS